MKAIGAVMKHKTTIAESTAFLFPFFIVNSIVDDIQKSQ